MSFTKGKLFSNNSFAYRLVTLGAAGVLALALAACGGGSGGTAATATGGGSGGGSGGGGTGATQTVTPPSGPVQDASTMTSSEFAALAPSGAVTSVSINSPPVATFQITDANGRGIKGLGFTNQTATAARPSLANLTFGIAKLVPGSNGSPSKWVNYIVTSNPTTTTGETPSRPTTDNIGTLIDNGDGTYKYTFYRDITKIKDVVAAATVTAPNNVADLGDLTYDPTKLHRFVIRFGGVARGTGTNTANGADSGVAAVPAQNPFVIVFDWWPATGKVATATDTDQREIVRVSACFECHSKFTGFHATPATAGVSSQNASSYQDTRMCVVCHTDQRRYGRVEATTTATGFDSTKGTYIVMGRAVGNFPNHIHKIHMGEALAKTGYNYAGIQYNEVRYPQDVRNCTKCHNGTDGATNKTQQGDNWKNVPSRLACGACHDGINFDTGKGLTLANARDGLTSSTYGHVGGIQTDDSKCALCHSAAAVQVYHVPVTPINPDNIISNPTSGTPYTNAAPIAANQNNIPAGAIKVTYDVSSVSRNANKQPVIVFRILQNGVRADLNTTTSGELWNNFIGSPSVYFVFAVPQDGVSAPADFNASVSTSVKGVWNGTATGAKAGTISGPDASGYYTITLTGVTIPDNAVMLTGGIGFSYDVPNNPPLTQTNVDGYPLNADKTGGLIVAAPTQQKVATGYTGRRQIVENARCNKCHEVLGVMTRDSFHVGQRNDANTCSWCHNPNRTSAGWAVDSTAFVHGIHGASKRTQPFTWEAMSADESYAGLKFPGILKNCEACHLPGTYDFSASASASALPNRLYRTVGTNKYDSTSATGFQISPYVTADNVMDYGTGFSFSAATGITTAAAATTLVNSPIATACFACHDSDLARQHMESNGGSLYRARGTPGSGGALDKAEQCTLCHASGKVADIKAMHAK